MSSKGQVFISNKITLMGGKSRKMKSFIEALSKQKGK
jgi:hypothetical protein